MTFEQVCGFAYAGVFIPRLDALADEIGREEFLPMPQEIASRASADRARKIAPPLPRNTLAALLLLGLFSLLASVVACSGRPSAGLAAPANHSPPTPVASSQAPTLAAGAPRANAGKPEAVAADTQRVTSGGVRYIAPAGWTLLDRGSMVVLTTREGDCHVAIVDATAAEPDEAVSEAWKLYRQEPPPPLKLASDAPAREGWDQTRNYDYELSPNAKRWLGINAFRHGKAWAVVIWDNSNAGFGKRGAQFGLVWQSLRPESYQRESFAGKQANVLDVAHLAKLDDLIELGRRELGIPGTSIAIVQRGKVIQAKGYGVRELGKATEVDANTLFMIASNTKAMTTLLLAQLVDAGKLRWDEPVTEAYPDFKLGDGATTSATRIEHLVCACTGLPRKDFEWIFEFKKATPVTELASLAHIQPTTKFGETFQYSNSLAAAAGFVAAHVALPGQELGKAYDAAMQARIFGPLGMHTTTFDFTRALHGNHASPHGWNIDARTESTAMGINYAVFPLRPAGGAWSSAREVIQYVRLELERGVSPNGKRIVSERNLLKRREPYAKLGEFGAYGMGLGIDKMYGITTVGHDGGTFGFKSKMFWLPGHGVGAVILTNANQGDILNRVFYRYLLELLFDGKPEAIENLTFAVRNSHEWMAKERARLTVPPDAVAAKALAPHYENAELGTIDVRHVGSETRFDFGEWSSGVASRDNDDGTRSFVTTSPGTVGFNFVVGKSGEKRTLTLREAQHEYVFLEGRPQ
jgi:CubicO group peptidase (beta-lactamase class C family)